MSCSTLTVSEAAKMLGMSPHQVRTHMKNGTLPIGIVVGSKRKTFVIYREKVEEIIGG